MNAREILIKALRDMGANGVMSKEIKNCTCSILDIERELHCQLLMECVPSKFDCAISRFVPMEEAK